MRSNSSINNDFNNKIDGNDKTLFGLNKNEKCSQNPFKSISNKIDLEKNLFKNKSSDNYLFDENKLLNIIISIDELSFELFQYDIIVEMPKLNKFKQLA